MTSFHTRVMCLALFASCGVSNEAVLTDTDAERAAQEEPLLRYTQDTSHWAYHGLLPELDNVSVTVSLAGHTAHVTGLLPVSFTGVIPFYVVREAEGTRTRVHVVYPIASANTALFNDDGTRVKNPEAGQYTVCDGTTFEPTGHSAFGGFPFIEYVCHHVDADGRVRSGIAFHGPITTARYESTSYWSLLRGPVSHACNRMLGEHVLELARLTGFEHGRLGVPVKVVAGVDTFRGQPIDVDYPASGFVRPSNAFLFRTWQAVRAIDATHVTLEFPRWACEVSRCPSMPPNRLDPVTGNPL
jgi:hypothetical protein